VGPEPAERTHIVFVVSDATGTTGERVVRAALMQFATARVLVERVPEVRTTEQVREVVQAAAKRGGTIVHTLVSAELRQAMLNEGRARHVMTIDLMGPLLTRLSDVLEVSPLAHPGLFEQLDEGYFQRIDAINFTVAHDDGRKPQDLSLADVVLVGVSRTCKTPISIYLSYRGWRVANVPLLLGMEPAPQLFAADRRRVVGLTIREERLVRLRQVRLQRMRSGFDRGYADAAQVGREVEWAQFIFRRGQWPLVDVTNKSIEEAAAEIVALVTRRTHEDRSV